MKEFLGSNKKGQTLWKALCDCGRTRTVVASWVKLGITRTCGCQIKHGQSKSDTYSSWVSMRGRCSNLNDKNWKYYGGKGVGICARWDSFENFLADMGERPDGKTLDRLDSSKGYSPENCRWATKLEQMRNRSISPRVVKDGVEMSLYDACNLEGLDYKTVLKQVKKGITEFC